MILGHILEVYVIICEIYVSPNKNVYDNIFLLEQFYNVLDICSTDFVGMFVWSHHIAFIVRYCE